LDQQLEVFVAGLSRRMEGVSRDLAVLVLRNVGRIQRPGTSRDDRVEFARVLTKILQSAQARGEITAELDGEELGAILGGMTMEALTRWATGASGTTPLRDSLALRFELVLDGLRR
jgi:hypothetical protein